VRADRSVASPCFPGALKQMDKSFLVLFSKKNVLLLAFPVE
jgi:hypothetical protein